MRIITAVRTTNLADVMRDVIWKIFWKMFIHYISILGTLVLPPHLFARLL
jgi:hypothetical protein